MQLECRTWDDVDRLLARLGEIQRTIKRAEADAEARMNPILQELSATIQPLQAEAEQIRATLENFCRAHRDEMGGKSRRFPHGTVGFRTSSRLGLLAGWTWEKVVAALKAARKRNLIRVKEEPDKEALKRLPVEEQKRFGVQVQREETFYAKPAEAE